jgi:glutamate-1-semialdehyde 2,1-aminomutase
LIVDGGVIFGGTFNGNPLSMAGAHAALTELSRDNGRPLLDAVRLGGQLMDGIREAGKRRGVPLQVTGFGTGFSLHFTERTELRTYRDILDDDRELFRRWLLECLEEGIYLLPDGRFYVSIAHSAEHIAKTLEVFDRVLARCASASAVSK